MRSKGGEGERINSYKVVDNPPQVRTSSISKFALCIYIDSDQRRLACGISLGSIVNTHAPLHSGDEPATDFLVRSSFFKKFQT